jgi:hypothetical protein
VRRGISILLGVTLVALLPVSAFAGWSSPGAGSGYSQARALASGNVPTGTVSGRSVTVSWTASGGTVPVSGYVVKRYDSTTGVVQTIGSGCSGTIAGLTCTEQAVPGGQWRYSITTLNNNWRGAESAKSAAATVASPSLSLSTSSTSTLPAALTGQIENFISGQTVTFRLDNATSGTVLTGGITPSPVPASGSASVNVTLPAGTANGAHTIYAIGSGGDTASAAITVSAPVPTTITTSAWDGRDASAGAGGVNQSEPSAYAGDLRTAASGNFATAFSTTRYLQYAFNSPLPPSSATSSVAFNFSFAGTSGADTTCVYFDVRRASTGTVVGTYGSAAVPVGCTTGTTQKSVTTPLPEVTTSTIANDLLVRVYASSSGSRPLSVDLATISGATTGLNFTLYRKSSIDAATGTPAAAAPWSLFASDTAFYASTANWATTFASTRFIKLAFPAYVPTGAVVNGVSFKHSYRSANAGANVCYYFEVYSGATLIGTHGSAATPVSCTSSATVWQTDTVALPAVTTVAAANALSINLYVSRNSAGKSRHDLAELAITYTR